MMRSWMLTLLLMTLTRSCEQEREHEIANMSQHCTKVTEGARVHRVDDPHSFLQTQTWRGRRHRLSEGQQGAA